jgi:hypothetical protein
VSLDTARYRLYEALKTLRATWNEVEQRWRDPVRQQFEQQCWNPLEPTVVATMSAIDTLSQVLVQARQECR